MPRGGKREGAGRPRKLPIGEVGERTATPKRKGKPAERPLDAAVAQAKDLTLRLLDELDAITAHIGEIEREIVIETLPDRDTRRRNAMLRAVSLGSRTATLKTLLAAAAAWAALEQRGKAAPPQPGKKERAQAAADIGPGADSGFAHLDDGDEPTLQ